MNIFEAIILGLIQGLTEFLPVSSSGHLEIGNVILGIETDSNLLFTVFLHLATALSTIVVFRKDIGSLLLDFFKFQWNDATKYLFMIALSMVPVGIVGVFFEKQIDEFFTGNMVLVGSMLMITSSLLFFTHYAKRQDGDVTFGKAFIIGLAQAVAILPGISRSGATISIGLLLGVDKSKVTKFSFLMVLVPILGAGFLKFLSYVKSPTETQSISYSVLIAGFLAAFVSGYIACRWMIEIVKKGKLTYFAIYCSIVGLIAIAYGLW